MTAAPGPAPSLARRLTIAILLVVLVSFGIIAYMLVRQFVVERDSLRDRALTTQAADIAAYLRAEPGDAPPELLLPDDLAQAYAHPDGQYVFLISDIAGKVLLTSGQHRRPLAPLPTEFGNDAGRFEYSDMASGGAFFGATLGVERGGRQFWVQVAQGPVHPDVLADTILVEFLEYQWSLMLLFGPLLIGTAVITVRRALSPLKRISEQAAELGPGALDQRLDETGLPMEVLPLVRAMNRALGRIEEGYQRQREFTATAAHELRTPLAILKAELETQGELVEPAHLLGEIDVLERLVQQLLLLAQADNFALESGEQANLSEVAKQVAEQLGPQAFADDRSLAVLGGHREVWVDGNAEFIALAVRNLVENALVHTQLGAHVEIIVDAPDSITVADNGPGIAAGDHERMFDRFWRGDRTTSTGAGFGLAIVARIIAVHGGLIEVAGDGQSGTRITLRFAQTGDPEATHPHEMVIASEAG